MLLEDEVRLPDLSKGEFDKEWGKLGNDLWYSINPEWKQNGAELSHDLRLADAFVDLKWGGKFLGEVAADF